LIKRAFSLDEKSSSLTCCSGSHFIRPDEMDFVSGLEEIEATSYDEPPPRNMVEKVWRAIM